MVRLRQEIDSIEETREREVASREQKDSELEKSKSSLAADSDAIRNLESEVRFLRQARDEALNESIHLQGN